MSIIAIDTQELGSAVMVLRGRVGTAISDASGLRLDKIHGMRERHFGIISDYDPRLEGYSEDYRTRVERAGMRREIIMRRKSINNYLDIIQDNLEIIKSVEANASPAMVAKWKTSRELRAVSFGASLLVDPIRRMRSSASIVAEYGACRKVAEWVCAYKKALYDFSTDYSRLLYPDTLAAGSMIPHRTPQPT